MSLLEAKIEAQKILLHSRKSAVFVGFFAILSKLFFLFALGISLYSLKILPTLTHFWENIYFKIGFYILFSLAGVLSMLLYALTDFSEKRWFYENTRLDPPAAAFFKPPQMRHIFKIGFLFWLRQLLRTGCFLLYLAPFLLGSVGLYYALRTADVPIRLLYITLGALVCILPICLFYGFAAVQRYAFCDGLLAEDPTLSTVEVLRLSRTLAKASACSFARFKLHFALWQVTCVLILPLFYVLPYYRQSTACAVKTAIDKNHLSAEPQKPIVFLLPARVTA